MVFYIRDKIILAKVIVKDIGNNNIAIIHIFLTSLLFMSNACFREP